MNIPDTWRRMPIRPSDVKRPVLNKAFGHANVQMVAARILLLVRYQKGDTWDSFTWREYLRFCSHNPGTKEKGYLDELVAAGFLIKEENDTYHFTPKALKAYA